MRERTLQIDVAKLTSLSELYRPSKVASRLGISKQRWHRYQVGRNDMPESIVKRLCAEFNLSEKDLVLEA